MQDKLIFYKQLFLKNKSLAIAVFAGVVLITIAITLIIIQAFTLPDKIVTQNTLPNVSPTQPVPPEVPIATVSPAGLATGIGLYPPISVTFTKQLTEQEQKTVSIEVTPQVKGTATWSNNGKTLTLQPDAGLRSATDYAAHLRYKTFLYTWTFSTVAADKVSQQDQQKEQSTAEVNYQNAEQAFYTKYPWYDSLPLQTDSYFVYFNKDANQFVGLLYPKTSSATSVDDQVLQLKAEITTNLQNLGINVQKYPISWSIKPEL